MDIQLTLCAQPLQLFLFLLSTKHFLLMWLCGDVVPVIIIL